jgi:eukaryotic-like serine/threonine-protein kinase
MESDAWDEESIFHIARKLTDPGDRAKYLNQVCGNNTARRQRIEAMLAAHEQDEEFLKSSPPPTIAEQTVREGPGAMVGPYKLLQKVGEGGMGVVFMADQMRPVQRRVALKIIKPGMDTQAVIARFEAERQALAMMDHPNIAHVLDAGATDTGRPYFVMELVKGKPVTQYCDEQRWTVEQRLTMFLTICRAVHHAHQKGVIHRDLKPSNILVAEYDDVAVPKIIDFGVAKATSQRLTEKTMFTALGQVVGTLEYMSPEQAKLNQLDVDIRTDIYSLGVLLYELLTGTTPLEQQRLRVAALDEAVRMIRQEEPPRPSLRLSTSATLSEVAASRRIEPTRLRRLVRGELDWIVMKALEKDRTRRYDAAATFAEDIRRYLAHERVTARPPTPGYLMRKFVRRNRGPVTVGCVLLVSLLLGLGFALQALERESGLRSALATRNVEVEDEKKRTGILNAQLTTANERLETTNQELTAANDQLSENNDRQRRELYKAEMPEALAAYGRGDLDTARDILNRHRPEPGKEDLRGIEWDYLWNVGNQPVDMARNEFPRNVTTVIASNTGERIVACQKDNEYVVYDISPQSTFREISTGRTAGGGLIAGPVSFSPGGDAVASCNPDMNMVLIRDTHTGSVVSAPTISRIHSFIRPFSGDLLYVQTDDGLESRNWKNGAMIARYDLPPGLQVLAISPSTMIMAGNEWNSNELVVWSLAESRELGTFTFQRAVHTASFSYEDEYLAVAGYDGTIDIFTHFEEGFIRITTLPGHTGTVFSLSFSPSDNLLASSSRDNTVRIWSIPSGEQVCMFRGHDQAVRSVSFTGSGDAVVSAGGNRVCLWPVEPTVPRHFPLRPRQVREVLLANEHSVGFYEIGDSDFRICDLKSPREEVLKCADPIWAADHADGIGYALGGTGGVITILKPTGSEPETLSTRSGSLIHSIRFQSGGQRLIAGTLSGVESWVRLDDEWTFEWMRPASAISLAAAGELVASGSGSGVVECWSEGESAVSWKREGHREDVYSVAFSRDGSNLLSCSLDGSIKLWSSVDGTELVSRTGEPAIWWAMFTPDDAAILSTGDDGYVTVRDRQTLEPRFRFPKLDGAGKCLAFSPSGKWLAVSTLSGQVQVWDVSRPAER